jgi:MoaA/NifB/PqqE/SkfB family radical SAM enzyme
MVDMAVSCKINLADFRGMVRIEERSTGYNVSRADGGASLPASPGMNHIAQALGQRRTELHGSFSDAAFVQFLRFHLFDLGKLGRSIDYSKVLDQIPFSPRPEIVSFISTKLCNFRCPHCYNASGPRKQGELSSEEKRRLVHYLGRWGVRYFVLSGGEPTLDPDFSDMIQIAGKYRMGVKVTTNGWRVPAALMNGIRSRTVFQVNVSLDGSTPQTHDQFRLKTGSYERVLDALRQFRSLATPNLVINACIHKESLDQMEELVRIALAHGCNAISFKAVTSSGRKEVDCETFSLSNLQLARYEEERRRLHSQFGEAIEIDGKLITEEIPQYLREAVSCNAASVAMMIDADGRMLPCEVIEWLPDTPNFREHTPSWAWL